MLDNVMRSRYFLFFGFLSTAVISYVLKEKLISNKKELLLSFTGPIIYMLAIFIVGEAVPTRLFFNLFGPITWAFLLVVLILIVFKSKINTEQILCSIIFCVFYTFGVSHYSTINYDTTSYENIVLNEFKIQGNKFLNNTLDTTVINPEKKLVLVETWSQYCGPCIKSIKDLSDDIDKLKDDISHKLVYINPSDKKPMYDTLLDLNFIKPHQDKVLFDIENKYYDKMGMKSYPYFLLYDTEGNLIEYFSGYGSKLKASYMLKIEKAINTHSIKDSESNNEMEKLSS